MMKTSSDFIISINISTEIQNSFLKIKKNYFNDKYHKQNLRKEKINKILNEKICTLYIKNNKQ